MIHLQQRDGIRRLEFREFVAGIAAGRIAAEALVCGSELTNDQWLPVRRLRTYAILTGGPLPTTLPGMGSRPPIELSRSLSRLEWIDTAAPLPPLPAVNRNRLAAVAHEERVSQAEPRFDYAAEIAREERQYQLVSRGLAGAAAVVLIEALLELGLKWLGL